MGAVRHISFLQGELYTKVIASHVPWNIFKVKPILLVLSSKCSHFKCILFNAVFYKMFSALIQHRGTEPGDGKP